jgi:hypothetical protein
MATAGIDVTDEIIRFGKGDQRKLGEILREHRARIGTAELAIANAGFVGQPARVDADNNFQGNKIYNAVPPTRTATIGPVTLVDEDKGGVLLVDSSSDVAITLPANWGPGHAIEIHRVGTGNVTWSLSTGATLALKPSQATHTKISERNGVIVARVRSNPNGATPVWVIGGDTN